MTGLDPARHVIVEIATIVTDDELEIVAEGPDLVVHQPAEALAEMDAVVRTMHTSQRAAQGHRRVDGDARGARDARRSSSSASTCPTCAPSRCAATRSAPTGGSSPCYLPEIEEHLHYRSVDVSTIKELTRRWYPGALDKVPRKATAHRALDDIRESIAELRWYREHVFRPNEPSPRPSPRPDADRN